MCCISFLRKKPPQSQSETKFSCKLNHQRLKGWRDDEKLPNKHTYTNTIYCTLQTRPRSAVTGLICTVHWLDRKQEVAEEAASIKRALESSSRGWGNATTNSPVKLQSMHTQTESLPYSWHTWRHNIWLQYAVLRLSWISSCHAPSSTSHRALCHFKDWISLNMCKE